MNTKGFTLIELLVVVLIIGILAAVALPQYTKAVEKSRAAEAMQMLGDIATAQQLHYMASNSFVEVAAQTDLDKFDLSFPGFKAACTANGEDKGASVETSSFCITIKKNGNNAVATAYRKTGTYAGESLNITVEPSGKVTRGGSSALTNLASTWAN